MNIYHRLNPRGITTLTLLILLASLLTVLMMFNDDILRSHSALVSQRAVYVEQNFQLQQLSQTQKNSICDGLSLQSDEQVRLIQFDNNRQADGLRHFIGCQRQALFKHSPKIGLNEGLFEHFIAVEYLPLFQSRLSLPPSVLPKDRGDYFYWFDASQREWELTGNIYAVVVAEGDLTISGKGRISGAVITKGRLQKADDVQIAYRRTTVANVVRNYSRWLRAENSWNDFKAD